MIVGLTRSAIQFSGPGWFSIGKEGCCEFAIAVPRVSQIGSMGELKILNMCPRLKVSL